MNRLCRLVLGLGLATAVVAGSSGCGESREARKAEGPPAPKVEKRVAGYLSVVNNGTPLDDFDRLVLTYGADVCAIELAKSR
ncbi:MAG: hypothetical protein F9K40_21710, partial [Kofleriaceae bacterium]